MVVIFDLDDTLYEELTFVKSGFKAVAEFLAPILASSPEKLLTELMERLEKGRGSIFDDVLLNHGQQSKRLVAQCLTIYRLHQPVIQLYPDASQCLERLQNHSLYIVTDGNKIVQANKAKALGVLNKVKKVFITHRYGVKNAKPSVYCFEKIRQLEKTVPENMVYVGDNPSKDFVGLKPLGFKTVRIMRGNYVHLQLGEAYDADKNILSLDELTEDFLKNL